MVTAIKVTPRKQNELQGHCEQKNCRSAEQNLRGQQEDRSCEPDTDKEMRGAKSLQ